MSCFALCHLHFGVLVDVVSEHYQLVLDAVTETHGPRQFSWQVVIKLLPDLLDSAGGH